MIFRNLLMAQQQKERTFTVVFDSAGGNEIAQQTVKRGERVKERVPERTGYRFTGWALNGTAFDFSSPITGNITLVASWEIRRFTVTFDSAGGSDVSAQTVAYGSKLSYVFPIRENYNFTGWLLNGVIFDFNTSVMMNMTLIAGWEYSAKLETQSGTGTLLQRSVPIGDGRFAVFIGQGSILFPTSFKEVPSLIATANTGSSQLFDLTSISTVTTTGSSWAQQEAGISWGPLTNEFPISWSATGYI